MSGYDTITKIRIIFNSINQRTDVFYEKKRIAITTANRITTPAIIEPFVSAFMMFGFNYNIKFKLFIVSEQ